MQAGSARAVRFKSPWTFFRCRTFATPSSERAQGLPDQHQRQTFKKLPPSPARTRFAPSPTGYLHLGSLRTALFNYLLAKATGGQFLLRVEDTDQKRTVADAEARLYKDLHWAGIQWDEGPDIGGPYGPYKQSERTSLYRQHAVQLLRSGHAYRCFCSPEREGLLSIEKTSSCCDMKEAQSDDQASQHEPYVVRLRSPPREPVYTDVVYGIMLGSKQTKKSRGSACFQDPVLLKSDGYPTYHLANVVDDHHMKITHVIRGAEWMSSTPKHITMYEGFGWEPPVYAHVGLLQNEDRQKYSKREGNADLDMSSLKRDGVFPEALINYVVLHGWFHNLGNDLLRMSDLIENFDLRFTKGNTIMKPTKLNYLQKRYAEIYANEEGPMFSDMVERTLAEVEAGPDENIGLIDQILICPIEQLRPRVTALLRQQSSKYTSPKNFFERFSYFFYPESHLALEPRAESLLDHLDGIESCFEKISSNHWDISSIDEALSGAIAFVTQARYGDSAAAESRKESNTRVQNFLRWAVCYGRSGPAMKQTMIILGREVTLERIRSAKEVLLRNSSTEK